MSLIIAMRNVSGLAPISDYEVNVYINDRKIAGPFEVLEHERDEGWEALVKKWADTLIPQRPPRLARSAGARRTGSRDSK